MTNLANLAKYIGQTDWSWKVEEQTPVTTEPQLVARDTNRKNPRPRARQTCQSILTETVQSCSGFIDLRRWISRILYK